MSVGISPAARRIKNENMSESIDWIGKQKRKREPRDWPPRKITAHRFNECETTNSLHFELIVSWMLVMSNYRWLCRARSHAHVWQIAKVCRRHYRPSCCCWRWRWWWWQTATAMAMACIRISPWHKQIYIIIFIVVVYPFDRLFWCIYAQIVPNTNVYILTTTATADDDDSGNWNGYISRCQTKPHNPHPFGI